MPDMQVAFEQHPNAHFNSYDPIYTAAHQFEEQLYADWSVRTEDPWEANMFYVPALVLAAACEAAAASAFCLRMEVLSFASVLLPSVYLQPAFICGAGCSSQPHDVTCVDLLWAGTLHQVLCVKHV
jgi:hypothetical protein